MTEFKYITKGTYYAFFILKENFHVDDHDMYWFGEKNIVALLMVFSSL